MMVEVMLDSGSSVSLVRHDIAKRFNGRTSAGDMPKLRLVSAGEEELPIMNNVKAAVKLSGIEEVPEHSFIVVDQLISQVILGVDFLQQQGLVLDFTTLPVLVTVVGQKRLTPVSTAPGPAPLPEPEAMQAIRKGERERREKVCIVASLETQLQMRRTSV